MRLRQIENLLPNVCTATIESPPEGCYGSWYMYLTHVRWRRCHRNIPGPHASSEEIRCSTQLGRARPHFFEDGCSYILLLILVGSGEVTGTINSWSCYILPRAHEVNMSCTEGRITFIDRKRTFKGGPSTWSPNTFIFLDQGRWL